LAVQNVGLLYLLSDAVLIIGLVERYLVFDMLL